MVPKIWTPKIAAMEELARHGHYLEEVKVRVDGKPLVLMDDPFYWIDGESTTASNRLIGTELIGVGFRLKVVRDEDGMLRWEYTEEQPQKKQKKPWMTYGLLLDICASILGLLAIALNNIPAAIFAAMMYLGNGED